MAYTAAIWCWNHAKPTGFELAVLHTEWSQIGRPVPLLGPSESKHLLNEDMKNWISVGTLLTVEEAGSDRKA